MMPVLSIRGRRSGQKEGLVARAAYCARRRMHDERRGRVFDFSQRPGLAWSELSLPDALPAHLADPERLWNAIETESTRSVAGQACELIMGLPRGRPLPMHAAFVRGFVVEAFVTRGQAVDWHIHYDKAGNLHAHALASPAWAGVVNRATSDRSGARGERRSGLHATWRRHCERWGFTCDTEAFCLRGAPRACAYALGRRGIMTRRWRERAARQALVIRPPGNRWPAWLRLRLRRRARDGRDGREGVPGARRALARER